MYMNKTYIPESALAIVAHPDDIEFSCVGTLARWIKGGTHTAYVICTSGDAGIADPKLTREQAAAIREAEALEAARIVGVTEVTFLHYHDGVLVASLDLRQKLVREIRRFRPEVVLTGDPTLVWADDNYINHPDHRAASLAAVEAVFPAAGQPHVFEELAAEGLKPHKARKLYCTNWRGANTFVSIDETIELKIESLRAHKSQMRDWDPGPRIREWASERARSMEMEYAEGFQVVTLESDEDWQKYKGSVENRV
jgi:LmbE family N-acetylglucosaminyl deacetylase